MELEQKIKDKIIKEISLTPGVVGFSSLDFEEANIKNKSITEAEEAIKFVVENKRNIFNIAIKIKMNVMVESLTNEISSIVEMAFKKDKIKMHEIKIYIRGVLK